MKGITFAWLAVAAMAFMWWTSQSQEDRSDARQGELLNESRDAETRRSFDTFMARTEEQRAEQERRYAESADRFDTSVREQMAEERRRQDDFSRDARRDANARFWEEQTDAQRRLDERLGN